MNIYIVNRDTILRGPFDIIDSHREQILNVGDICLREINNGIAFLYVYGIENTWKSCISVGVGRNDNLEDIKNNLIFSFDGINKRKGNISVINQLIPCFREKVIVDFFCNAIDILEYKRDSWDLSLFQQFFSPNKEIIDQEEEEKEAKTKSDKEKSSTPIEIVKEVSTGIDSPYLTSPTSNQETRKLFKQYRSGDKKAFDKIVNNYLRLVHKIANSYRNKGAEYDDLVQEGTIGLIKAIDHYDYNRNIPFSMYAKWWIIQAVLESIRTLPYTVKLPQAQISLYFKVRKNIERYEQEHGYEPSSSEIEIDEDVDPEVLSYISSLPDDLNKMVSRLDDWEDFPSSELSADDNLMKESRTYLVNVIIRKLKKKEADILRSAYGIGTKIQTLEEIADRMFLTRERVRQIKEKAVRKLRDILKVSKGGKEDDSEDEELDGLSIEEIERRKIVNKKIKSWKEGLHAPSSGIINPKKIRIINNDYGCEIRDYYNNIYFTSTGKIKTVEGDLYYLSYQKSFFNISLFLKSSDGYKVGNQIVYANNKSPLYLLLTKENYCDKIELIKKDYIGKEYKVLVGGVWYNETGFPIIVKTETASTKDDNELKKEYSHETIRNPENKKRNICEVEVGCVILYDLKKCTVLEKKEGRLVVEYEGGTIDNLKDDKERYEIIQNQEEKPFVNIRQIEKQTNEINDAEIEQVYVDTPYLYPYKEIEDKVNKGDSWLKSVNNVRVTRRSKRILKCKCEVVLSQIGYCLIVNRKFIKLGDFPEGFSENDGNIWIKKPIDKKGFRIIHEKKRGSHFVGYIKEKGYSIIFTDPDNKVFKI